MNGNSVVYWNPSFRTQFFRYCRVTRNGNTLVRENGTSKGPGRTQTFEHGSLAEAKAANHAIGVELEAKGYVVVHPSKLALIGLAPRKPRAKKGPTSLRELIREHELDAHAKRILSSARPCIVLKVGKRLKRPALGVSRVGGAPDLPANVEWPRSAGEHLHFVAQLDLASLPTLPDALLPKKGFLWFFVREKPSGDLESSVLFSQLRREQLERRATPEELLDQEGILGGAYGLSARAATSLPDEQAFYGEDQYPPLRYALLGLAEYEGFAQMLGHPMDGVPGGLERRCLLLGMDSDSARGIEFPGGLGLHFFIARKDLLNQTFARTRAMLLGGT